MLLDIKFFGFLIIGAIIYWLIKSHTFRNLWLIIISFSFLAIYDVNAIIIIITTSIFSYAIAIQIERSKDKRLFHRIGLVCLILLLVVFKYLGFLNQIISDTLSFLTQLPQFNFDKILLPLGISYITFKHISYITDIYAGVTKKGSFIDFLLYSSLFTIFIAGPIERFEKFLPQSSNKELQFNPQFIEKGFERIVFGIFKKAVIADWTGYLINPIWTNYDNNSLIMKLIALIGFSVQIYMDFSAYSDIAIGSSYFFGFKIMENFNNPYLKQNISQFWRSWHISLSDWIRDYIFFPLGNVSSNKIWMILFVPIISMGLCGLWHGASWQFVIWGIWHGVGLSILQLWNQYKLKNKNVAKISKLPWFNYASILLTFFFVTIGWIWFK
jgi:alginate O-acetyltransferase complex protein AlgI